MPDRLYFGKDSAMHSATRRQFEQLRVATPPKIGAHSMHHLALVDYSMIEFAEALHGLETYMLAEKLADDTRSFTFKWPASAFQSWKLRHRRLKRFLPKVKYKTGNGTVRVKSWATYPEANVVIPEFGKPVILQEVEPWQSSVA